MEKDVTSNTLTLERAAFVRQHIFAVEGSKTYRKDRQAVIKMFGDIWPSLAVGRDENPTNDEIAADKKATPESTLTLSGSQWNAVLQGFIHRLLSEANEGDAAGILSAASLLKMKDACMRALPQGETGKELADGEEEPKPDETKP